MPPPAPIFLFTVSDRFEIQGKGLILLPGIPWTDASGVKRGDGLILRKPLGEVVEATSRDFEMVYYRPNGERNEASPILLEKKFHKFDIPMGTELFLAPPSFIVGSVDKNSGDHDRN